jgi:hypothetical protein
MYTCASCTCALALALECTCRCTLVHLHLCVLHLCVCACVPRHGWDAHMQSSPMATAFFAPFMPQGGETPLHVAAASDNLNADVVKFLVAAGANLDLKNKVRSQGGIHATVVTDDSLVTMCRPAQHALTNGMRPPPPFFAAVLRARVHPPVQAPCTYAWCVQSPCL